MIGCRRILSARPAEADDEQITIAPASAYNITILPGDTWVRFFLGSEIQAGCMELTDTPGECAFAYREEGQTDDDWVFVDDDGWPSDVVFNLTNDTTYEFELAPRFRFPPSYVDVYGDASNPHCRPNGGRRHSSLRNTP